MLLVAFGKGERVLQLAIWLLKTSFLSCGCKLIPRRASSGYILLLRICIVRVDRLANPVRIHGVCSSFSESIDQLSRAAELESSLIRDWTWEREPVGKELRFILYTLCYTVTFTSKTTTNLDEGGIHLRVRRGHDDAGHPDGAAGAAGRLARCRPWRCRSRGPQLTLHTMRRPAGHDGAEVDAEVESAEERWAWGIYRLIAGAVPRGEEACMHCHGCCHGGRSPCIPPDSSRCHWTLCSW